MARSRSRHLKASSRASRRDDPEIERARPFTVDRRLPILGVAIALIALAVYLPALANGFVNWDDPGYVLENAHVDRLDHHFLLWSLTTFQQANWHPITWLSLGVDHALWGKQALGYHLTNVLLHATTTLVVVLLAGKLFTKALRTRDIRSLIAAAVVGLLFAVHPIHVESVAWISERKDLVCGVFYMLSLVAYLRFSEGQPRLWYLACLGTFAIALLAKPMAVSLPLVLLILDVYPLARLSRPVLTRRLVEKVPFAALAAASTIMTMTAQSRGGAMVMMRQLGIAARAWNAERSLGFYIAKLALPINLVPFYPLDYATSPREWGCVLSAGLILGMCAAAWAGRRRWPLVGALWTAYLVMLLPVIGIIQVGQQAAADRYMYLPMLVSAIAVAALAVHLWPKGRLVRAVVVATVLTAIAAFSAVSIRQITVWRDSFTLWTWVIKKEPNVAIAHYNLGEYWRGKGDLEAAARCWLRASELEPSFSWPLNQLGNLAMLQGKADEARRYYEQAIRVNPKDAEAQLNYAEFLDDEGHAEEARRHYEIFLRIAPSNLAHLFPEVRAKLSVPVVGPPQPESGAPP
jgi:4-amino-4-deoxy-L-arabinose transferase-like glycosyltransferase